MKKLAAHTDPIHTSHPCRTAGLAWSVWISIVALLACLVTPLALISPSQAAVAVTQQQFSSAAGPRVRGGGRAGGSEAAKRAAYSKARLTMSSTATVGQEITARTGGPRKVRKMSVNFGDGTGVTRRWAFRSASHAYTRAGTFRVTLSIIDRRWRRHNSTATITVTSASSVATTTTTTTNTAQTTPTPTPTPQPGPTTAYGALVPTTVVSSALIPQAAGLPASKDLSGKAMEVRAQSPGLSPGLGSCVTWAVGYGLMGWHYKNITGRTQAFAPMYIYSQAHGPVVNNTVTGMSPLTALNMLKQQGIDTRENYGSGWEFDWQNAPQEGDAKWQNAANYRISGYNTLFAHPAGQGDAASDRYKIMSSLAGNSPVAIGMATRSDFDTFAGGWYQGAGVVDPYGNHEMLALGYNSQGLLVQNSWGTDWGQKGYMWMTWDVVARDVFIANTVDGIVTRSTASDSVKPVVSQVAQEIVTDTVVNDTGIPVRFTWSATDNGQIAGYALYVSTNGGDWAQQALGQVTNNVVTYSLTPGNTYRFAVRAIDTAGNWSDWATGNTMKVTDYDDSGNYVTYTGNWERFSWNAATNGTLTASSQAGATASFTFIGRSVAWIATAGANRGQANIYLDGQFLRTVDLYSATTIPKYVTWHGDASRNEKHTLTIQVVGTQGRPTVDVDSFFLLYD